MLRGWITGLCGKWRKRLHGGCDIERFFLSLYFSDKGDPCPEVCAQRSAGDEGFFLFVAEAGFLLLSFCGLNIP